MGFILVREDGFLGRSFLTLRIGQYILMKNKYFVIPLIASATLTLGFLNSVNAATNYLAIEEARQIALKTYRAKIFQEDSRTSLAVTDFQVKQDGNGNNQFYILQINHKGFVVISANRQHNPVIGYGTDYAGSIKFDQNNIAFNGWLDQYETNQQSRDIQVKSNAVGEPFLRRARDKQKETHSIEAAITPMTTTLWSQNNFYNDWVPNDYLTGCVATALGQFLKYHEYPTVGIGSHTYKYPEQEEISINFAATTYHWDSMTNSLAEENAEVAKLLFHTGAAVSTLYGSKVSLAGMRYIPNALEKHFGYITNGFEYVSNYAEDEWKKLILNELKAKRVVMLTGLSTQRVGHAWVVDGYDGQGYFHMNWVRLFFND